MIKRTIITLALIGAALTASAQWCWPACRLLADTCDTSRTAVHLSVGSMVGAGFGRTEAVSWAAPSFRWRANERLTLRGGFAVAGPLLPGGYALHGRGPQQMLPYREGTELGGVWAQAEWRAGERLLLWGSVARLTGFAQPLWASHSLPVDATEVSGGFAYRFSQGSVLAMHFRFVHDEYGYLLHSPYGHSYCGPLAPGWEMYGGPWTF